MAVAMSVAAVFSASSLGGATRFELDTWLAKLLGLSFDSWFEVVVPRDFISNFLP